MSQEDKQLIRDTEILSAILDLTTDDSEWIVIHDETIRTISSPLLHIPDWRAETIAARLIDLFNETGIDKWKVVEWSSDECSSMLAASRILQNRIGTTIMVVHCFFHRVDFGSVWGRVVPFAIS